MLQINSKWKPNREFEDYNVENYLLRRKTLEKFQVWASMLRRTFKRDSAASKFRFQYQYGLNNLFEKLNSEDLKTKDPRAVDINGKFGPAAAEIVIYLLSYFKVPIA